MAVDGTFISEWEREEFAAGFHVYCHFLSLKLHFTKPEFSYANYGPLPNLKFETFFNNQGKAKQFAKLARRFNHLEDFVMENFLIANLIKNPKAYPTTMMNKQAQANYDEYRNLHENFTYNFVEWFDNTIANECMQAGIKFNEFVKGNGVDDTPLLQMILRKELPVWFLVGLSFVTGFRQLYDKTLDNPFWAGESLFIRKVEELVPKQDYTITKTRLKALLDSRGLI